MPHRARLFHRLTSLLAVALLASMVLNACGASTTIPAASYTPKTGDLPDFSHIFVIMMENRSYDDIMNGEDTPYITQLASQYGLATKYYAITHPSLPNYIATTSGDTQDITSDCTNCFVDAQNLVDSLEAGGKTWRAYMEDMPQPCFVGDAYPYMQKHNPFIYYDDIRTNPTRCADIVPLTRLSSDIATHAVPDFVWITPNMCHDMHDCTASSSDAWLKTIVPQITSSHAWKDNGLLVITWDEGTDNSGCCQYAAGGHIATLVISPLVPAGTRSAQPYDHYSLLRTITQAWGLREPGHAASAATRPLVDFFGKGQ